jgi:hypothetical protein
MPASLQLPEVLRIHPWDPPSNLLQRFATFLTSPAYRLAESLGDRISSSTARH